MRTLAAALAIVWLWPAGAAGQTPPADPPSPATPSSALRRHATFLLGAAAGLAVHETGHATIAAVLGANPRFGKTSGSAFSFFAIHHDHVSRQQEYVISSAGFWFQHAVSEAILTTHPRLRDEDRPFMKGIVIFHLGTSAIYSIAAFARIGPDQRDTRGMAVSLGEDGVPEPAIGALILAPAVFDAYRYWKPGSKWVPWASRASKLAGLMLALGAGR
ncbi:MAG TPA: hypothetical protein VFV98_02055 [Vicinamibacterales bacterium]|nr:hypothetical protein [Vicinamibacterales bacterium]